ncbi:MAG: UDP-N-acetylglucosamine 2-epimerase (non-hydrolyzing) [Pseudomonadota bacterium]
MKLLTVVGARPQFIKAAAVSRVLREHSEIQEQIVHTGQHYDANMSSVFFEQMSIPQPTHNLGVSGLSHGAMTGQMLTELESVFATEKPDRVLVYGDTNSTLAAALAASKLHIPLAHVEAGLRSHNIRMPEEVNRIVTDRLSDLLFCPTQAAIHNLTQEGFEHFDTSVELVGDVMQDAAMFYASKSVLPQAIELPENFILATVHRAENTDDETRLHSIVDALNRVHNTVHSIVLPLHPRTAQCIEQAGLMLDVMTIEPVGYLEMIALIQGAQLVMTDSGGLQKEAYFFETPCVTLRDETEWVELIESGANVLAGADIDVIESSVRQMLNVDVVDSGMYGNGQACERIVASLR